MPAQARVRLRLTHALPTTGPTSLDQLLRCSAGRCPSQVARSGGRGQCAISLLGALGGGADLFADLLPGEPGGAGRGDGFGDLAFAAGTVERGAGDGD